MLHIFYVICKCEQKMSYNIDIPKISRSMELFTLYLPICHLLFHPPLCIPEWVVQTTNVYKSIRSNILWPKRWKCSILWIHTIWSHAFSKSVLCTSKLYHFMYSWFRMCWLLSIECFSRLRGNYWGSGGVGPLQGEPNFESCLGLT